MTPLLLFKVRISATPVVDPIQSVLLSTQIQIQPPQRSYSSSEKERLVELFGTPDRWGQTLRNRLLTHANTTVGSFTGSAEAILSVPCSYDLNIAATKYFYALDSGEVSLLFLFSGSVFYAGPDGRLQVEPISWSKEATFRLPVQVWRELMEQHYPNCAWLYLQRDVFDQLFAYKRRNGHATWEQAIEELLERNEHFSPPKTNLNAGVTA